jgi:hypothetical protein
MIHRTCFPAVGSAADKSIAELSEGENGINEHGFGGTLHNPDLTIYLVVCEMNLSSFRFHCRSFIVIVAVFDFATLLQKQQCFPSMDGNGESENVNFVDVGYFFRANTILTLIGAFYP